MKDGLTILKCVLGFAIFIALSVLFPVHVASILYACLMTYLTIQLMELPKNIKKVKKMLDKQKKK